VLEREARLDAIRVRVRVEEGLELRIRGLGPLGQVFEQELELLAQPSPHDRVVAVEPERQRLAVQDLLAQVVFDQPVELDRCGWPAPSELPALAQAGERARGHDDAVRPGLVATPDPEREEQTRADEQEVQERLAQPHPPSALSWIGWVYPHRPLTREYQDVLKRGHVRGADLWHLANALFIKRRLGDVAFLTLDERQREVAKALDFAV